jgi:hypothetical protein
MERRSREKRNDNKRVAELGAGKSMKDVRPSKCMVNETDRCDRYSCEDWETEGRWS